MLLVLDPMIYFVLKEDDLEKKVNKSKFASQIITISLFSLLFCLTIATSVFLLVSLRYKQYLYYLEYWKKLLLQSLGMVFFLAIEIYVFSLEISKGIHTES